VSREKPNAARSSAKRDEFVSCILPTRNRPQFLAQAIRCFQCQTYPLSELIVIDDGEHPVADLCASVSGLVYVRLDRRTPTGTKLNVGVEHARGSVLQKLDDDDYYHPHFLELSVSSLPVKQRDQMIVAWDCFLILLVGQRSLRYSGHGWAAGGTLLFSRKLWSRRSFRALTRGSDSMFRRDHGDRIARVCAPEHYILVRHGRNTWNHIGDRGVLADAYMAKLPIYPRSLDALLAPADRRFYTRLMRGESDSGQDGAIDRLHSSRIGTFVTNQMLPVSSRSATISRSRATDSPAASGRPASPSSDNLAWWKC
jgi:glycosyltransferase involved in cell wall biosynthesis